MKRADVIRAEEIVEAVLRSLDHRHYSDEDFKASQIVKALDEAGFMKDPDES